MPSGQKYLTQLPLHAEILTNGSFLRNSQPWILTWLLSPCTHPHSTGGTPSSRPSESHRLYTKPIASPSPNPNFHFYGDFKKYALWPWSVHWLFPGSLQTIYTVVTISGMKTRALNITIYTSITVITFFQSTSTLGRQICSHIWCVSTFPGGIVKLWSSPVRMVGRGQQYKRFSKCDLLYRLCLDWVLTTALPCTVPPNYFCDPNFMQYLLELLLTIFDSKQYLFSQYLTN